MITTYIICQFHKRKKYDRQIQISKMLKYFRTLCALQKCISTDMLSNIVSVSGLKESNLEKKKRKKCVILT